MAEDEEPGLLDMLLDQLEQAPASDEALGHLAAHFEAVDPDGYFAGVAKIGRRQPIELAARYVAMIGIGLNELHPETPGPAAADGIAWARATCDRALVEARGLVDSDAWQLLIASAALRGEWMTAGILWEIAGGGSGHGECPHCNRSVEVATDGRTARLIKPNGDSGALFEVPPRPPIDELGRLAAAARAIGHEPIANALGTLNGTAQCPYCKRNCAVWDALCEGRA